MTRIGVIWRNALEAVCPRCLLRIDIPRKSLNYKKKKETNNWRKDVLSTKRKVCVNITSKFSPWLSHSVSTSSFSTPAPYPPPLCVVAQWLHTGWQPVWCPNLLWPNMVSVWYSMSPFPLIPRGSLSRTQCGHTGQAHLPGPGKSGEGLSRR